MKVTIQRKIYIYSFLFLLITIESLVFVFNYWDYKWYYSFVYFLYYQIGNYFYSLKIGVILSKLVFLEEENNKQIFVFKLLNSRPRQLDIIGVFENKYKLRSSDLDNIITKQSKRKMFYPLFTTNEPITINYIYQKKIIDVEFYRTPDSYESTF